MTTEIRALYTRLPAIDRLLRDPAFSPLLAQHGHSQVVAQLRQMLDEARGANPPVSDTAGLEP